jgi:hypothetical protein
MAPKRFDRRTPKAFANSAQGNTLGMSDSRTIYYPGKGLIIHWLLPG